MGTTLSYVSNCVKNVALLKSNLRTRITHFACKTCTGTGTTIYMFEGYEQSCPCRKCLGSGYDNNTVLR